MVKKQSADIQFKRLSSNTEGVQHCRALNALFAEAFDEENTYLGKKPSDKYLLELLENKDHIVCVALSNHRVVAGLVAYVLEKFEQERREIYIYDLAVDQRHRRQKIATGLITFLQKEADEIGAWVVYVQADVEDLPAIKLYESFGIREEVLHFDLTGKLPADD